MAFLTVCDLPDAVLGTILASAGLKDRVRWHRLSHRWRDIGRLLPIREMDLFGIVQTPEEQKAVLDCCLAKMGDGITRLKLPFSSDSPTHLGEIGEKCPNLVHLTVDRVSVLELRSAIPRLKSLAASNLSEFGRFDVEIPHFDLIVGFLSGLTSARLDCMTYGTIKKVGPAVWLRAVGVPQPEKLGEIDEIAVTVLPFPCPNLRHLSVNFIFRENIDQFRPTSFGALKSLKLGNLFPWSSVPEIIGHVGLTLEALELYWALDEDTVKLIGSFKAINRLPKLKDLRVQGYTNFTAITFDALFTPALLDRGVTIAISAMSAGSQQVELLKTLGKSLVQLEIYDLSFTPTDETGAAITARAIDVLRWFPFLSALEIYGDLEEIDDDIFEPLCDVGRNLRSIVLRGDHITPQGVIGFLNRRSALITSGEIWLPTLYLKVRSRIRAQCGAKLRNSARIEWYPKYHWGTGYWPLDFLHL